MITTDDGYYFIKCISKLDREKMCIRDRGKSAWDKKWVRLPKHKAGYDIELLNPRREYIMELLKPVYQVFSDKKSTRCV